MSHGPDYYARFPRYGAGPFRTKIIDKRGIVTPDEILLASDLLSHRSLNEFMARDEEMCQCHDVCRCPGMTDNPQGGPMSNNPVRLVMLPIALGAFAAAGQAFLNGADTRGIVTAVLGALVLAAQEYARARVTPVPESASENDWHIRKGDQLGYGAIELLVACFIAALLLLVVLALIGRV